MDFEYWNGGISGAATQMKRFWLEILPTPFTTLNVFNHVRELAATGPVEIEFRLATAISN